MTYNPNANWTAAIDSLLQAPVYFVRIDGLTTKDYATHPVKSAATTKVVLMDLPRGGGAEFDILDGTFSVQRLEVDLLDVAGEITALVATDAAGAPLPTLINRKVTVYAGYADLAEADYAPIFTGRVVDVRALPGMVGYTFTLADLTWMLDGQVMTAATEAKPTVLEGNIVNLYWAILTGTFSTSHATFPLESVSVAGDTSSAPTGLGLATSLIDEAQLVAIRDLWNPSSRVKVTYIEPVNARQEFEIELFRMFQCWPAPTGSGLLSLRFIVPVASTIQALAVTETDHVVNILHWRRRLDLHLNKFTYRGDYDHVDREFDAVLYDATEPEDTTDRSNTGETIEYLAESRWMRTEKGGTSLAAERAGRLRALFEPTPAEIVFDLNLRRRNVELGDVLAITHHELPDLLTGVFGVAEKTVLVVGVVPEFERGVVKVRCLELTFQRYGAIGPDSLADYDAASAADRKAYAFIGRELDNKVGTALDAGYVVV